MFFHLLDVALVNANILYNSTADKPMTHMEFRLTIARSLLENHSPRIDRHHIAPARDLPLRMAERPFPEPIPRTSQYSAVVYVRCVSLEVNISKQITIARSAKWLCTYIHALKFIIASCTTTETDYHSSTHHSSSHHSPTDHLS